VQFGVPVGKGQGSLPAVTGGGKVLPDPGLRGPVLDHIKRRRAERELMLINENVELTGTVCGEVSLSKKAANVPSVIGDVR